MERTIRIALPAFQRLGAQGLLVLLALLSGARVLGADTPRRGEATEGATERRVVITVGEAESTVGVPADRVGSRSIAVRLPQSVTLHGFRVDVFDSLGQPVSGHARWAVDFFVSAVSASGAAMVAPTARLSAAESHLTLPRPFGVRLDHQDSLIIVVTLSPSDVERGALLQITLEYEPLQPRASRLPVLALSAQREDGARDENLVSSDEAGEGRWSLRPTVAGRLVAISGRAFACAQEVVLEDVRTGRVLWRTRPFAPGSGGTADQRSEVIRPGVSVEADRTYELRATYATSSDDCGKCAPLAMLFPQ